MAAKPYRCRFCLEKLQAGIEVVSA